MSSDLKAWVGRSQTQSDTVMPNALVRYKAALNMEAADTIVPDGYHWCLCLPDTPTDALGADGHPPLGGFMPSLPFPRRMWAGSKVEFLKPLAPHMQIERRSTIMDIEPKSGQSGELVFVTVAHETLCEGDVHIRETQTIVYRDAPQEAAPLPEVTADVDIGAWDWHTQLTPQPPLLFRYSALTFNTHRIHYDLDYAQNTELYPALVVHGPLTASLLLKLCADHLGHHALSEFRFTAKSPLYAGQPVYLVGRETHADIELCALGGDGRLAMQAHAKRAL